MKNQKFIHLLLAVALICGQLVANVHTVGHLHSDDCEFHSFSQSVDCANALQAAFNHAAAAGHVADHQHPDAPRTDYAAEDECAIYHALSGLNGLVCVSQKVSGTLALQVTNDYAVDVYLPATIWNTQPIRAPPVVI